MASGRQTNTVRAPYGKDLGINGEVNNERG